MAIVLAAVLISSIPNIIKATSIKNERIFTDSGIGWGKFFDIDPGDVLRIETETGDVREEITGEDMNDIIELLNDMRYIFVRDTTGFGGSNEHRLWIYHTDGTDEMYIYNSGYIMTDSMKFLCTKNDYFEALVERANSNYREEY